MEKVKYLKLFVLLAFLAGQVQYAYVASICTMKQMAVQKSAMSMNLSDISSCDVCDESQGVIPQKYSQEAIQNNCVKIVSFEKNTIDSFAEWAKLHTQVVALFSFIQADDYPQQIGHQSFVVLSLANSPPLDLPTLNSNLRI